MSDSDRASSSDAALVAALRAVESARLACDAARAAVVSLLTDRAGVRDEQTSDGCSHPVDQRRDVVTFGDARAVFCAQCGETL